MQDQVKRLLSVVEHLQRKSKVPNQNILLECYEVFSECVLIVQREISIEVGTIMDRLFILLRDMLESAISQIKPPPEPREIIITPQIPAFVNALQLGSVSILDQLGTPSQLKNIQQIPWSEYKCKGPQVKSMRTFQDVGTSTLLDYYLECQKASSSVQKSQEELKDLIEFTNDTIALMSEALANKKQLDIEYAGTPGELDLAISEIQFKRLNLESIIKSVNAESFGVQNFDHTVQFLQSHIHHIQQQTAVAILARLKQRQHEKDKLHSLVDTLKLSKKKKANNSDCRCAQYINDIMQLKNKLDQLQGDLSKKERQVLELEVMTEQKEIQYKMTQQQNWQLENDKMEFKSKFDTVNRELTKLVKKNSERGYVSSSSNDEILINGVQATTSRDQSQNHSSHKQIYLSPKDNYIIQKKTQQMERLVKLVNALDPNNQTRRLTQMQFILEQKAGSQIHELADLIKEIEENDLMQNDSLIQSKTQNDAIISTKNLETRQQSSFDIDIDSRPAIKVSVPVEYAPSNRAFSSTSSQKKDSFGFMKKEMNNLNPSPNHLAPHYPLSKAKSSSNLHQNIARQNSIKSVARQNSIKTGAKSKQLTPNLVVTPINVDEYIQTEWTMKDNQIQTDRVYSRQVSEQETRIINTSGKGSQQQMTTSSTFHVGSAGTMGMGGITTNTTPNQSNPNSNLPSPRNQQPIQKKSQVNPPSNAPYPSPNKLQNVKQESENSQQITSSRMDIKQATKSWKQRLYEQQEQKHQVPNHRRMHTTTQSQTTSPMNQMRNSTNDDILVGRLQQEYDEQIEEERLMYNEALHDIPEQNELDIIQKAVNRTPGFELAPEISENILQTMFGNLERNPDIVNVMKKMSKNGNLTYLEFKRFVNRMQATHRRCGRECNHLMRFYLRLGFVSTKYLNKRKLLKLSKPKVLPGFK